MSANTKLAYSVEVIGFNQTERIVLASIFGLSARRAPKFLQHANMAAAPDMFLVDASDAQAVALFKARNVNYANPAILIGEANHGTPFPVLARPLQWTKLFKAFDLAIETARVTPTLPAPPRAPPIAAVPTADASAFRTPDAFEKTGPLPTLTPLQTPLSRPVHTPPPSIARSPAAPVVPAVAAAPANQADWVLVVDDNLTVREFMKSKLAPFGFNVDFASSGEQAVGFTGQKNYTCVFLDVIMPGIDGYQVCKLIKSKKSARKTAVVMLTSKSSPFDRIRGAMAGCDAYLTKPVNEDKLLETIVKFIPITPSA